MKSVEYYLVVESIVGCLQKVECAIVKEKHGRLLSWVKRNGHY